MRIIQLPSRKPAFSLRFSADGSTLAAAQWEAMTILRPLAERAVVRRFDDRRHTAGLPNYSLCPVAATIDGGFIVNTGVWSVHLHPDREFGTAINLDHSGGVLRISFSADGRHAIAATGRYEEGLRHWLVADPNAPVHLWNTPTLPGTASPLFCFFPDGNRVAVAGTQRIDATGYRKTGNLAIHALDTGARLAIRRMRITAPNRVLITPDSARILVCTTASFHVFDVRNFGGNSVRVVNPGRQAIHGWALHPSGRQLVTVGKDSLVRVWETNNWREVKTFNWDVGRIRALAFSPDGTLCAAAASRGRVVVWDWEE